MRTTKIFFHAFSLLIPMIVVILTSDQADAQNTSSEETTQLAILRSDAPNAEKAIACKKLTIHGSSESVSASCETPAQRTIIVLGENRAGSNSG